MILCWHTSPSAWGLRAFDRTNQPASSGATLQPATGQLQVLCKSTATERESGREAATQRAEQPEPGSEPLVPLQPGDFPRAPVNRPGRWPRPEVVAQIENFFVKEQRFFGELLLQDLQKGFQSEALLNQQAAQTSSLPAVEDPSEAPSSSLSPLFSDASGKDQVFTGASLKLSQDGRRAGRRCQNGNARLDRLHSSAAAAALAGVERSAVEAAWLRNDPAQPASSNQATQQQHLLERKPRVNNAFDPQAYPGVSFASLLVNQSMPPIKDRAEEARLVAIMQEGRRLEQILQHSRGAESGTVRGEAAAERQTGLSYSTLRRRIRAGHSAHEHLLRSNYMMVMKLVRDAERFGGHAISEEDLCQAGLDGLRKALEKFDGTRGAKVSTFAYQAIRNTLYRTFMDSSRLVRIPQSTLDRVKEVQKVVNAFFKKHDREPTIPELQQLTGLSANQLQRSEAARKLQETQLDALIDSSSGSGKQREMDKLEMIADMSETPDQETYRRSATALILEALKELPEREAFVLASLYGLKDGIPKTLKEVSQVLQVSHTRVWQIKDRGIKRLRTCKAIVGLEAYRGLVFGLA